MAFKMNYSKGGFPFKKNEDKKGLVDEKKDDKEKELEEAKGLNPRNVLQGPLEPTIVIPKKTVSKVHRSDKSRQEEEFEKGIKG